MRFLCLLCLVSLFVCLTVYLCLLVLSDFSMSSLCSSSLVSLCTPHPLSLTPTLCHTLPLSPTFSHSLLLSSLFLLVLPSCLLFLTSFHFFTVLAGPHREREINHFISYHTVLCVVESLFALRSACLCVFVHDVMCSVFTRVFALVNVCCKMKVHTKKQNTHTTLTRTRTHDSAHTTQHDTQESCNPRFETLALVWECYVLFCVGKVVTDRYSLNLCT